MDNCVTIQRYKQALIDITNSSELTIGCAYYIAKDFFNSLEHSFFAELQRESVESPVRETVEIPLQEMEIKKEVTENGEQNND